LPQAIDMAVAMKARLMEVAIVQFHGWAMLNRASLMPTRAQAQEASAVVEEARKRLKGTLVIDYVPADYHSDYPKRCMGGWGTTGLNVTPDGLVLPCHAAQTIKTLDFDNVQDKRLADIWYNGAAFNAYRGEDWMQDPCKSCDRRKLDFGGCRCQAMAIAGDANATDPVCIKSPQHQKMKEMAEAFSQDDLTPLVFRESP
ncbi:MAG: SPASM domain-containing protein, partial [Paracoccaceae bacterium]